MGAHSKYNAVPAVFQSPSLLAACTRKVYLPGGMACNRRFCARPPRSSPCRTPRPVFRFPRMPAALLALQGSNVSVIARPAAALSELSPEESVPLEHAAKIPIARNRSTRFVISYVIPFNRFSGLNLQNSAPGMASFFSAFNARFASQSGYTWTRVRMGISAARLRNSFSVPSRVIRHATDHSFLVQKIIRESRYITHVDSAKDQPPTFSQRFQCRWHNFARRGEHNRRIELHRP